MESMLPLTLSPRPVRILKEFKVDGMVEFLGFILASLGLKTSRIPRETQTVCPFVVASKGDILRGLHWLLDCGWGHWLSSSYPNRSQRIAILCLLGYRSLCLVNLFGPLEPIHIQCPCLRHTCKSWQFESLNSLILGGKNHDIWGVWKCHYILKILWYVVKISQADVKYWGYFENFGFFCPL